MAKKIVFDKDAFVGKVRSDVITLESGVEKYLADIMQKEAKSNVNDDFKDTLAQFKAGVTARDISGNTKTFPDEVYKVLLASHAVEHKLEIENIDGTLIKEMQAYISDILGTNKTVTTADGESYKVDTTFANAGLATVTYKGRLYTLNWRSDSAKESLYSLLGSLKTWGQNLPTYLFEQLKTPSIETLFSSWSKALITCKFSDVVSLYNNLRKFAQSYVTEENVSEWTGNYASKWLGDLTKKLFPDANKEIAALQEKYQKLDDLARDTALLKDYKAEPDSTADAIKNTVTGLTSYKNFLKAYNDLQTAIGQSTSNFDSIIPDYIGYEISNVVSDSFSENNATITCANVNNQIEVNGSNVSVDTGRGKDTIQSGSYSESNSKVKIHAGDGDDEIYNYSSNSTIDGGTGEDFIRSDSKGINVSISGGDGFDTIDSHGNHNTIDGGAGNDSISNYGDNVTISGDDGADTIRSYGSDSSVFGGAGDDELLVMSSYVDGGTGADTISIQGSYVTVYGGGSFDYLPTKDVFNIASGASNVYINDFEFGDVLNLPVGNYTARIEFGSTVIRDSSGKLIVWLKNFIDRLENFTYDENGKQTSDGDDSVSNDVSNIKIDLGAGDDTINNSGNNVSINGGGGNDSISNRGNNITIDLGDGNDSVYSNNQGYHSTIIGGNGNDCIRNDAQYVMISGDDGDDNISNDGNYATIIGGNGNDSIDNWDPNSIIDLGDGNDSVYNSNQGYHSTIIGGNGNDKISNDGVKVSISGDKGDDTIGNGGASVTVDGGDGNDYIRTSGSNDVREFLSSMSGGNGNDTIIYDGDYYMDTVGTVTILGGDGDDSISNAGRFSTIDGGTGNDTIFNTGKGFSTFSSINSGEGNDVIYSNRASGGWMAVASIVAGTGDDTIYNSDEIYLEYALGDGNDIIYNSKGHLYVGLSITSGAYGKIISGDDLILKVGEGSITLKDFGDYERQAITFDELGRVEKFKNTNNISLNIYGIEGSITTTLLGSEENDDIFCKPAGYIETFGGDDKIYTSVSGAEIVGGKGNDTISGWNGMNSFLVHYTYGDGDDVIYGFNSTSTLSISGGEYVRSTVGNDVIITVGDGSILLKDAKGKTLNIDGTEVVDEPVWTLSGKIATYGTPGNTLVTVSGVKSLEGLYLSGNTVTISEAALGTDTVSISSGYSLALAQGVDTIKEDLYGWTTLSSGNVAYLTGGTGSYYSLSSNGKTITYNAAVTGANQVELSGVKGTPTLDNNFVSLTANNFASDVSLVSNAGGFQFVLSGNFNGKSFTGTNSLLGSTVSDTIHNHGQRISINTGAGDDYLYSYADNVTIDAGEGDDYIYNNGSNVLFNYRAGDGNDYISGSTGNDKLYGQNGNDTLWGGSGNDTFTGGAGADTFIYNSGEGKDVISDFSNDDLLQITGTFSATYDSSANTISFKVGSTASAITLKNFTAASFKVNDDSYLISGSKLVTK